MAKAHLGARGQVFDEPKRWQTHGSATGLAQLSTDQAVADYGALISSLRRNHSAEASVRRPQRRYDDCSPGFCASSTSSL